MDVRKLLVFGLFAITINSEAEIYRWVDNNGKVHFTDRKPAPEAENITNDVKPQNIDTSSNELNKIAAMREQEEKSNQEQRSKEYEAMKAQVDDHNRRYCEERKKRLKGISGRVVFLDEQGKAVTVTEKERQQMVATLKQEIQTNCSQ